MSGKGPHEIGKRRIKSLPRSMMEPEAESRSTVRECYVKSSWGEVNKHLHDPYRVPTIGQGTIPPKCNLANQEATDLTYTA